jgi:hypothetical protein
MNGSREYVRVSAHKGALFDKNDLARIKDNLVLEIMLILQSRFKTCYYINVKIKIIISRCCSSENCYRDLTHFFSNIDFFFDDGELEWRNQIEKEFLRWVQKFSKWPTETQFYLRTASAKYSHRCVNCLRFKYLNGRCEFDKLEYPRDNCFVDADYLDETEEGECI